MIEKTHVNNFIFRLYQGKHTLVEKTFSADAFNPFTRYSVDIRSIIPSINQRLQRILSKKNLTYSVKYGDTEYNFLDYYIYQYSLEKKPVGNKLEKPPFITQTINNKVIKGIECKFGLYINKNPIVERDFYVDGYNPSARFSVELPRTVDDICSDIFNSLVKADIYNMWDDYALIKTYGIYAQQIRELTFNKRKEFINYLNNENYVRRVKSQYRRNNYNKQN